MAESFVHCCCCVAAAVAAAAAAARPVPPPPQLLLLLLIRSHELLMLHDSHTLAEAASHDKDKQLQTNAV
jgi:hypothetical protein